jgi:hypothetical protein
MYGRNEETQEQRAKHNLDHNLQGCRPSNLQGWRRPSSSYIRQPHSQLLANSTLTTYHLQGWSIPNETIYQPSVPRDHL